MAIADVLLFRVNGTPRGKARPRFTKHGRAYTPQSTRQYEAEIRDAALQAATRYRWVKTDEPLRVYVCAWFAVPQSFNKEKRAAAESGDLYPTKKPDADNIAKCLDALNDVLWHDDKQVVECTVRKRYCMSGYAPHLTVFVERMPTFSEMKAEALARQEEAA